MKKTLTCLLFVLVLLLSTACSASTQEQQVQQEQFVFDPYEVMGRPDLNIEQKFKGNTVYFNRKDLSMLFLDVDLPDPKSPDTDLYDTYPNAIYQYVLPQGGMLDKDGVAYISLDELKKVFGYGTKYQTADGSTTFNYKYNEYRFYDPSQGTNPTQVWVEDVVGTHEIIVSGIAAGATELTVVKRTVGEEAQEAAYTISLDNAILDEGTLYVPFTDFASKAWGMTILTQGDYVAVRKVAQEEPRVFASERIAQMDMCLSDTGFAITGNRWFVYYHQQVNKLMPYQVYVPKTYDPAVASKFVLQFHGGTGNENAVLSRVAQGSGIAIEPYADEYGYMILLPNAIISSSWGDAVSDDPATQAVIDYAEMGVYYSMQHCFAHFNVDTDKLFVQGNSMGSSGTVYFATNDTRLRSACGWEYQFRAGAPAGGNGFKDNVTIPMLWIWGERDSYEKRLEAYDTVWSDAYKDLSTVITVEHGHHSWAHSGTLTKAVYEFFDSVLDGTYAQQADYVKAEFAPGSNIAILTDRQGNITEYTMANQAFLSGYYNDVLMVSLTDLRAIFAPSFKAYEILDNLKIGWNFYGTVDEAINNGQGLRTYRNTYVLIFGNKTINIEMDINRFGGGSTTYEGDGLHQIRTGVYNGKGSTFLRKPDFSIGELPAAPIGEGSEVYVPVYEVLSALGVQ